MSNEPVNEEEATVFLEKKEEDQEMKQKVEKSEDGTGNSEEDNNTNKNDDCKGGGGSRKNEPVVGVVTGSSSSEYAPNLKWHSMDVEEVRRRLQLTQPQLHDGVSLSDVPRRAAELGNNKIPMSDGPNVLKMLVGHFLNSITLILGIVVVISGIFQDWGEFGVVLFVIIFNGLLGFYQEYSAEKSLQGLKDMTAGSAKVVRDGRVQVILIDDVVVGDLVILEQGASVPCDLRIIETSNLDIDEALLTGESLPVTKHVHAIPDDDDSCALGDRKNLAFRNSTVTQGRGKGVTIAAGSDTEMGKLAKQLTDQSGTNKTPLQIKMEHLMYALFLVCLVLAIIVFGAHRMEWDESTLIYASAVAIAILPESLIAVITVAMTISVRRMAQQRCIVRKLAALEVLGNVTDICSDKTGTLTENKMVTKTIVMGVNKGIEVSGTPHGVHGTFSETQSGENPQDDDDVSDDEEEMDMRKRLSEEKMVERFFQCASLCSTTVLHRKQDDRETLVGQGNPTEIAIQVLSWKGHCPRSHWAHRGWKHFADFPFDSAIKRMSVGYTKAETKEVYFATKGAPERVLALCEWFYDGDEKKELGDHERDMVDYQIQALARRGLRTICLAERCFDKSKIELDEKDPTESKIDREEVEKEMVFLGLVGIYDPPRPESLPSVKVCQHAGITVRMLTGDHTTTASAIAQQLNIVNDESVQFENNVMAGPEFDKLTDEEADAMLDLPAVVGRCSPDSKVAMIKALHRRGRIVAMTGDGFNDSPSIKIADIGCAMGSGTDVTKGVADIVLTDDNFATLVKAVAEGRRIASCIKKFVIHLLSGNVAEVIVLVLGLPIQWKGASVFILSPIEILWLNMFTGSPPATGLSLDEAEDDILHVPPSRDGFFTKELISDTFCYGFFLGVCALMSFVYVVFGYHGGLEGDDCNKHGGSNCDVIWTARATAFSVLYLGLNIHAYNVRSPRKSVFKIQWLDNRWLVGSVVFGIVTLVPILYVEPIATHVFIHKQLTWEWIVVLIALIAFMIMAEIYKVIKNIIDPIQTIAAGDDATERQFAEGLHGGEASTMDAAQAGLNMSFQAAAEKNRIFRSLVELPRLTHTDIRRGESLYSDNSFLKQPIFQNILFKKIHSQFL